MSGGIPRTVFTRPAGTAVRAGRGVLVAATGVDALGALGCGREHPPPAAAATMHAAANVLLRKAAMTAPRAPSLDIGAVSFATAVSESVSMYR
jgi:hypothetical protein